MTRGDGCSWRWVPHALRSACRAAAVAATRGLLFVLTGSGFEGEERARCIYGFEFREVKVVPAPDLVARFELEGFQIKLQSSVA